MALLLSGYAMAQTRSLTKPPTAAEFQQNIPENAEFRTARTINGRDAVAQLRASIGLDASALARFNVADPLNSRNPTIQATFEHAERMSRSKAFANAQPDQVTAQSSVGDTVTETWSQDGGTYTATYTWNGSTWVLTSFSWKKNSPPTEEQ